LTARSSRVRCAAGWLALALAVAAPAAAPDDPAGADTWPRTIRGVWYRTGTERGITGPKLSGDLVITPESLEFLAPKRDVSVPLDAVRMISLGRMRGDVDTDWVVLSVQRGDERELVGLRDGRKLGYGGRTVELYETLRDLARRSSKAQFAAPEGLRPYTELDRVFAIAVPDGWSVYHHDLVSVEGTIRWGTAVFTPRPVLDDAAGDKERARSLEAVQQGRVTAWVVERRESAPGMGCAGFTKGSLRTLRRWIADDPFFGRPFSLDESPSFEPASIDGCAGLRLLIRAEQDGPAAPLLDLRVVARDDTAVLVGLRSTAGELERDRDSFERGVSTLRLAATR
jgi:hypothetical protein